MDSYSVRYGFSQSFEVPAKEAYDWCVDYRPNDWDIMGKKGRRRISRLNDDTLILTDTVVGDEGPVTKRRLVRLNPERLAWTNTHIGGPTLHSQFWYQIAGEGTKSRLEFTGLQIFYGKRPSTGKIASMAKKLAEDDSGMWRLLAKEMKKDLLR